MTKYKDFREYYEKNLLIESPFRGQLYLPKDPDNINASIEWAKDIIKGVKKIGNIQYFGLTYYIYAEYHDNRLFYYVLNDNKAYVMAYMFFQKNNYGYTIISMWKTKESPLKVKSLLIDYFLPNLKWVFSATDNITDLGEKFWKDLILNLDENKFEFGLLINNQLQPKIDKNFILDEDVWNNESQVWIKVKEV